MTPRPTWRTLHSGRVGHKTVHIASPAEGPAVTASDGTAIARPGRNGVEASSCGCIRDSPHGVIAPADYFLVATSDPAGMHGSRGNLVKGNARRIIDLIAPANDAAVAAADPAGAPRSRAHRIEGNPNGSIRNLLFGIIPPAIHFTVTASDPADVSTTGRNRREFDPGGRI